MANSWTIGSTTRGPDLAKNEKLPSGFERLPSQSLRVRIRITGHAPIFRTFDLSEDNPEERRRQKLAATSWAVEMRRQLSVGAYVSTREAETTSLGDALRRYQAEGLSGKKSNIQKERNRIAQLLKEPISARSIASLKKSDIARLRDHLQAEAKAKRGKELARTTIANKLQLITRALNFVGEKMEGVPELTGVKMPKASHGRERRVSADEMTMLLAGAPAINPILSFIIRFAVLTALRRERILEFRSSYIHHVGRGTRAIRFPRETSVVTKRTGIIPITNELEQLFSDMTVSGGTANGSENCLPPDQPLFKINGNTFDHQWRRLIIATKIPDLHFHDLRHEATSRFFEKGLDVAEVMTITGHSTAEMVDRYTHYSAPLILEKLQLGIKPEALAKHIELLFENFGKNSGDLIQLRGLLRHLFLPASQ